MNTDTYSQGYICNLKTQYSIEDEVGKLMLSHIVTHVHTHAGYPIIVYQCYIPEFLYSGILGVS